MNDSHICDPCICTTEGMSIEGTVKAVFENVNAFKGSADQFDDITMLGFELVKLMK